MKEVKYVVTHEALLASTLNHLTAIYLGDEAEETQGVMALAMVLEVLKTHDQTEVRILVTLYAKLLDFMDLEAQMLMRIKGERDKETYDQLAKMDFSSCQERTEENLYAVSEILIPFLKMAGVGDLATSFAELDGLMQEVQNV